MKRSDMFNTLIKAQEELRNQGKDEWNISALSNLTGVSRPTIRKLRKSGFEVTAHGNKGKKRESTKLSGFEAKINSFLKSGCSNSSKILEELQKDGYLGSQTTIKNYISNHRELLPVRMDPKPVVRARRYETLPGDAMQMDWGFINVVNNEGIKSRLACFVMVCCHCRKPYIEFFTCARQEFLFIGMVHAFTYFGGLPKWVLTDNMKSVVLSRCGKDIIWNSKYLMFMSDLGFKTRLCKPRHAFTKGRVERYVRFVKENFAPGTAFTNLDDLNQQALEWCQKRAARKLLNSTPRQLHEQERLEALPPKSVLSAYEMVERTVSFDGFVAYEGRRFGVPASVAHKKRVFVLREGSNLMILDALGEVLQTHTVDWNRFEHYCEGQFEMLPEQPEELPTNPVHGAKMVQRPVLEPFDFDLSVYDRIQEAY